MTVVENTTAQRDSTAASAAGPSSAASSPAAPSPGGVGAKDRILATANRLFYYEGIRAVGVDRLISESHVTKATFYKHFGDRKSVV